MSWSPRPDRREPADLSHRDLIADAIGYHAAHTGCGYLPALWNEQTDRWLETSRGRTALERMAGVGRHPAVIDWTNETVAATLMLADHVADEVILEGERAAAKHGEPGDRTGLQWLAILAEEFGEVATEVTRGEVTRGEVPPVNSTPVAYRDRLRAELIQVASVASRWVLAIDRGEGIEP